jgi:hypothetical protein
MTCDPPDNKHQPPPRVTKITKTKISASVPPVQKIFPPTFGIFETPKSLVFTHIRDRGNYSINPTPNPHKKGRVSIFGNAKIDRIQEGRLTLNWIIRAF